MSVAIVAPVTKPRTRPKPKRQQQERPVPPKDLRGFLKLLSLTGALLGGVWRIGIGSRTLRMLIGKKEYCPLTAVAEIVTGKYFFAIFFEEAWEEMGRPKFDLGDVVWAADYDDQRPNLRIQLLEACGVVKS